MADFLLAALRKLEAEICQSWQAVANDLAAFPSICQAALAAFPFAMDQPEFFRQVSQLPYPTQGYIGTEFGDVSITILRNPDFRLDIYIWNNHMDTSLHNHHFAGAFRPLYGTSRQFGFTFEAEHTYNPRLAQGKLRASEVQPISGGDAVAIELGDEWIHCVQHPDSPTVTLCVRTDDVPGYTLYQHLFPGYRVAHQAVRQATRKALTLLRVMAVSSPLEALALLPVVLQKVELEELFTLFTQRDHVLLGGEMAFQKEVEQVVRGQVQQRVPEWLFVPLQHHAQMTQLGTSQSHSLA